MYRAVIGLEVHLQLKTRSKLFSACPADYHGAEPNTFTDPLTLGLPGTLPTLNREAVDLALMFGLALHCDVSGFTQFHRKNYFYPDAPKNFQLSQYDRPIARDGYLEVAGERVWGVGLDPSSTSAALRAIVSGVNRGLRIHDRRAIPVG